MNRPTLAALPFALAAFAAVPGSAATTTIEDPLRFWEGRTESLSTVKVVMKKPFRTRAIGRGRIRPDGSLELVQRVEEEGNAPKDRRWHIRKVGPGRYMGTMSEAKGPVTIEEVDGRYRFRFKMKGNLAAEQWLSPRPGGRAATSKLTIKKLGMTVGRSEGTVRKLD